MPQQTTKAPVDHRRATAERNAAAILDATEHLGPGAVHRTHELLMRPLHDLVERGRREGVFRTDLPADWLVSMYLALMHGAYEHATATGMRAEALGLLQTTIRDLYAA